jgi:hypothetical protein
MLINVEDRAAALAELVTLTEPYLIPELGTQGAKQSEFIKVLGSIGVAGAGNARAIVTADAMSHSPKTIDFAVANSDTDYQVAVKLQAALLNDADVSGFFDISGTGIKVILTAKAEDANDATMNLSLANGTCTGLTAVPTSTTKTEGAIADLSELEKILDDNLLATVWLPNHDYEVGEHVYPTSRNGHKYIVEKAGTSDATEPTFWPISEGNSRSQMWNQLGDIVNGSVTFREDGVELEVGYDMDGASRQAWDKKCAKASEFVSTPGIDMAKIFDRCMKMRDRFESMVIA